MRIRRMLGLFAFFYASLHLLTYVVIDQELDWAVLWGDVTQAEVHRRGLPRLPAASCRSP